MTVGCASPTRSYSCPAPAAGIRLEAQHWVSVYKDASVLKVCERGTCSASRVINGRASFDDGRSVADGAPIDLSLQLLDTNGRTIASSRQSAAPVRVVTSCCGGQTVGWLFVGTVESSGQLILDQPH